MWLMAIVLDSEALEFSFIHRKKTKKEHKEEWKIGLFGSGTVSNHWPCLTVGAIITHTHTF